MILNNVKDNSSVVDGFFEIMHEVKNSIAVCRGYLDIIDSNEEGDMNKYLSIIRNEINRSTNIIGEFMLYNKVKVIKEVIDINLLLSDLCNDMKGMIESKNILFDYNIGDDEVYIEGDYDKLGQVFINLIKNSMESISVGGKINLISYIKNDWCYILISDNGCGMSSDTLLKIMNGGFSSKENGNGIGVNFCNQIIKKHAGDLEYISRVGEGTKVVVKLPVVML